MLDVTTRDGVATVRMDHGPVNAMDLELLEALAETFEGFAEDADVRAVVLTGNARAFGAGVDLRRLLAEDLDHTRAFVVALARAFAAPWRLTAPVVAAVNGHAIAGGAVLAAACDLVLVTDDDRARIGLAELAVGVPFPTVAIELMRRRLGTGLGDAVWTAELFPPDEAVARGFADRVVPAADLEQQAHDHATRLAALPDATRRLTHAHTTADLAAAVDARTGTWEADVVEAWCSDEVRAAIAAFVERTLQR